MDITENLSESQFFAEIHCYSPLDESITDDYVLWLAHSWFFFFVCFFSPLHQLFFIPLALLIMYVHVLKKVVEKQKILVKLPLLEAVVCCTSLNMQN